VKIDQERFNLKVAGVCSRKPLSTSIEAQTKIKATRLCDSVRQTGRSQVRGRGAKGKVFDCLALQQCE